MGIATIAPSSRRLLVHLATPLALAAGACGPAPTAASTHGREAAPTQTVYIVLGEQEAPAPLVEHPGTWVPDEPHDEGPFGRARTWIGDYDCPQGTTQLTFRIVGVRDHKIRAIFDFHHLDSGAQGKYLMVGSYDEQTRTATFTPGAWIKQPPNYVSVGMKGDVALDGSLFAGRINHPECGAFRLRPAE